MTTSSQSTSREGGEASSSSSSSSRRCIGDYVVDRQIGSGSFSVVWHARHGIHGTEVAIKEILMDRLSPKLQESLVSEIRILKKINHPNIIHLHDIIEIKGRIHLILEYCKGGDLSVYLQRHGRVPEATAKHFMQQLAAGLQILRDNNLIHRDLKPQNLLLTTNDNRSVLKIADFGFARSLQPRGLAETLCGSPLYMAPEIMQFQKYDAKADLWSVGVIHFQLVTGKTPFTGNNQVQLLQNIMKSNELKFPSDIKDLSSSCTDLCQKLLRRDPVERLAFEEFFNHPFLSANQPIEPIRKEPRTRDSFFTAECNSGRKLNVRSQNYGLPFLLDDDISGPVASPSFPSTSVSTRYSNVRSSTEALASRIDHCSRSSNGIIREPIKIVEQTPLRVSCRVVDSLEFIDQEYVLVPGHPMQDSSLSVSVSRGRDSPCKSVTSPMTSAYKNSEPIRIIGATLSNTSGVASMESHSSAPSETSQGSMDMGDTSEQPSTHCLTRIRSLQQYASAITELVNEKICVGRHLEAFSVQLVILAIWKQALHICHTQAASAIEGSLIQESTLARGVIDKKQSSITVRERFIVDDAPGPEAMCSQIEREFLHEVGHAEELAGGLVPADGSTEMPDAMETIFQSALVLGRHGAVDELMGDMEHAESMYSKAVHLLVFLSVEAPSLILNPPFSLTSSDRFRIRSYIDILSNRQGQSRCQRMAFLKGEEQEASPPGL